LLVVINQGFKYVINLYAGTTGERMLRRLRFQLYGRILRFPLPQFRKTSSSEMVTMITAEVEPLGGFVGDAFKLPVFQGGYLFVILAFLFVQNWFMALAAVALYPLQGYLIPKLQRRVRKFSKNEFNWFVSFLIGLENQRPVRWRFIPTTQLVASEQTFLNASVLSTMYVSRFMSGNSSSNF
jgi:ABC-type multidrug transport system fused ATPase/permease subunit